MSEKWKTFMYSIKTAVDWLHKMQEDLRSLQEWALYNDSPKWVKETKALFDLHKRIYEHYREVLFSLCPCKEATQGLMKCDGCPLRGLVVQLPPEGSQAQSSG